MDGLSSHELNDDELREFAEKLRKIAAYNNIKIGSCAEKIDLEDVYKRQALFHASA